MLVAWPTPVFKISAGPRTLTGKIWVGLARFGKLSFFIIYKFSQNCASVRQVSDLILKTATLTMLTSDHYQDTTIGYNELNESCTQRVKSSWINFLATNPYLSDGLMTGLINSGNQLLNHPSGTRENNAEANRTSSKGNPWNYRKTSSIVTPKSQKLNVSCILLQLSSVNPLKPGVKLRMKM